MSWWALARPSPRVRWPLDHARSFHLVADQRVNRGAQLHRFVPPWMERDGEPSVLKAVSIISVSPWQPALSTTAGRLTWGRSQSISRALRGSREATPVVIDHTIFLPQRPSRSYAARSCARCATMPACGHGCAAARGTCHR